MCVCVRDAGLVHDARVGVRVWLCACDCKAGHHKHPACQTGPPASSTSGEAFASFWLTFEQVLWAASVCFAVCLSRSAWAGLGSLRHGGATFLLMKTEDREVVRRRGRWLSACTCEISFEKFLQLFIFHVFPFKSRTGYPVS